MLFIVSEHSSVVIFDCGTTPYCWNTFCMVLCYASYLVGHRIVLRRIELFEFSRACFWVRHRAPPKRGASEELASSLPLQVASLKCPGSCPKTCRHYVRIDFFDSGRGYQAVGETLLRRGLRTRRVQRMDQAHQHQKTGEILLGL